MLEPGSFTSSEELKQFQVSWDFEIYQPALNTAKETVRCPDIFDGCMLLRFNFLTCSLESVSQSYFNSLGEFTSTKNLLCICSVAMGYVG